MERPPPGPSPEQVGDTARLASPIVHLFGHPLHVGERPPDMRIWSAPSLASLPTRALRSFDDPVVTDDAATFAFHPALDLPSIMLRLDLGAEDIAIPTEIAARIVADVAQQLAHCGLPHPLAHPGAVLVGFDGISRTLRVEEVPDPEPVPLLAQPWDDDERDDTIGLFPIHAVFAEDLRANVPDPASDEPFRAPEEAEGRAPTSATVVWRLAAILLRLLDPGELSTQSRMARLSALREGTIALRRSVPDHLRALIVSALSVDAQRRPPTASAFTYHLGRFAAEPSEVAQWLRAQWRWTYDEQLRCVSETAATIVRRPVLPAPSPWLRVGSLEVMLRPVTQAEADLTLGLLTPQMRAGGPAVLLDHAQARAHAAAVGARLPTTDEWTEVMPHVIEAGGEHGHIWEWTSSPHRDGYVVRGGPWRNIGGAGRALAVRGLGIIDHRSWERTATPDVGFRLVRAAR
ncbi:MAG: hypothetical protein KDK70_06925 [Myxococcales bacterium]|nr:hypothetical protein [Myxococcales bacterium]